MAKVPEESDDEAPLSISEEWHGALLGVQLNFQHALFEALIAKGIFTPSEVQVLLFTLAERMRYGGDWARAEEVAYYFADLIEGLGNEFVGQMPDAQ